ncbi:MAG: PQQ-binding-like beta-propeller repeat protein [Planctomycetota bacterium]
MKLQWLSALVVFAPILIDRTSVVMADDWPGWMGGSRDGVLRESGWIDQIPDGGLPVKWRIPIAGGYAGPAVANGVVYVFDFVKESGDAFNDPGQRANLLGQERLTAINEATGDIVWQVAYNCPYSVSYPAGPRCTPTVDGDRVYTLGSEGDLKCFDVKGGTELWSRSLKRDFSASVPIWGFSAHPLIDGELLYTMVGGKDQGIVAFDKLTGQVRWKSLDVGAGYCPPSIIEHAGQRQLIAYHPEGIHSLDPATGSVYWNVELAPMYEMSINRPMVEGNLMYVSGIRTESVMIRLDDQKPGASEVWRGEPKQAVYTANSTPLIVDGIIYGTDCNEGSLIAVDATTGKRVWSTFEATRPDEKRFVKHGTAFITRLGDSDRYLLFSEIGDLLIAKMTADGFQSLGRFHVLEPTGEAFGRDVVWSHPAYANQTAFVRNDAEIVAVDLAKR